MDMHISVWGNSLGVRIPMAMGRQLGLKKGTRVSAEIRRGALVITPVGEEGYEHFRKMGQSLDLRTMVKRITAKNRPEQLSDAPAGKEIW